MFGGGSGGQRCLATVERRRRGRSLCGRIGGIALCHQVSDQAVLREQRLVLHTIPIILILLLIMLSSQLSPFGEIVLRARVVHFAVQLDDFAAELAVLRRLLRLRRWEEGVEVP